MRLTGAIVLLELIGFVFGKPQFQAIEDDVVRMHPLPDFEPYQRQNDQVNALERIPYFWKVVGKQTVLKHYEQAINVKPAKNIIIFLGDGMSTSTIAATRAYLGQLQGKTGEETQLAFESFPVTGFSKTYCIDSQVAESACSATAYLGGVKGNLGTLGVKLGDCLAINNTDFRVESVLQAAIDKGWSAGIVTTAKVTDASPAGTYAHSAHRFWENDAVIKYFGQDDTMCKDIAHQLIYNSPGNEFKVILGGGKMHFLPRSDSLDKKSKHVGRHMDGKNLIDEWKKNIKKPGDDKVFIETLSELKNIDYNNTDYLLGLFSNTDLNYHLLADEKTQPRFAQMVEAAISILSKDPNGYILFAEDRGNHATKARLALDETKEFSDGVKVATEMTDPSETLIVVTADHSHTMTYSGYPSRGNDILGPNDRMLSSDGTPFLTLSYANGPVQKRDFTDDDIKKPRFKYPAFVPMPMETHGGDDAPVYAMGPFQHMFTGVYEQNAIPHLIKFAACLDDELSACTIDENKRR